VARYEPRFSRGERGSFTVDAFTTMNQEKMRTTAFAMPLTNPAFPPVEKQIGDMGLFSSLILMS
jgi:hypothetical protein